MDDRVRAYDGSDWLTQLRKRFVDVASRRVGTSDVEDVVQDALRIVTEKGGVASAGTVDGRPPVAWCFQVLRNAIGNHYKREGTRRRRFVAAPAEDDPNASYRPAETLESSEILDLIEDALGEMRRGSARCAGYLARLVEGAKPQEIANDEGLQPAVFYRQLYRCRQKLRELLAARRVYI